MTVAEPEVEEPATRYTYDRSFYQRNGKKKKKKPKKQQSGESSKHEPIGAERSVTKKDGLLDNHHYFKDINQRLQSYEHKCCEALAGAVCSTNESCIFIAPRLLSCLL